ncbi:hypothetical protein GGR52DRAFT_536523 [Hypoxylon sp. FL1284]|nr:hypothetical protein GGR52DRAFT_536523 [Hypoxylon sp. FL1284]
MPSVLERLRYDYPRWRPQQISILRPADEEQREQEEEDEDQELEEQDIAGRQRRYEALRVASRQREAMRQGMRDGLTQSRRLASQQREVMQQVARQREAQRRLSLAYGVSMGEMTPLPLLPPREDETPERRTFHSEAEQFFDLMPMSFEDFIAGDDAAAERSLERPAALTEPTAQPFRSARRLQVRNVDGLGDRDRSLSPDPVAAWDTLQSTLTPDPQPPSAGSSFARVEEPEPPCDPLNETDAATPRPDGSRRSLPPRRRSYADVARAPSDASPSEIPDDPEWLSSLQQIVRNLASRQDIPDEWWARAGLSRSMSWEEDN